MLAEDYLEKAKINSPPVPADILSVLDEQCTVEVREVPLKAYHGAIWRLNEAWIIQLKDTDGPAEKRFSLFHEGFHILAHSRGTPVFKKAGAAEGSFNELLADYFAACVLMPGQWVKEKWPEVRDPDVMAKLFDVPKSAMRLRLSVIGLV
jgi:Zn-dependent peptidase ImmA (M78 family)